MISDVKFAVINQKKYEVYVAERSNTDERGGNETF